MTPTQSNSTHRRARAALLLLFVFIAGGVCGVVGERVLTKPRVVHRVRVQLGRGSGVYDQLGINDAQREQIGKVLQRYQPRSDSLLAGTLPQLKALMDSADAEVRRLLTPSQRDRLDSLQRAVQALGTSRPPSVP
jgi:hypothetical protein